jgi:Heparinase II/III-like protein
MCSLFCLIYWAGPPAHAQTTVLKNIRRDHPRLILTRTDWETLKEGLRADPVRASWYQQLRQIAETQMLRPRTHYHAGNGQLLFQSREALTQLATFGALYRLSGEARYAEAARQELLTVIAFPDWDPSHFLDTAEMTAAVALGYDWAYDALGPADRKAIESALVSKGLQQGLQQYESHAWWIQNPNNWNVVCHGGLTLGALAIADVAPDVAERTVELALRDVPYAMNTWAPDGAWPEGLAYWNYTSQYNVLLIASLQSAVGSDGGLMSVAGFSQAGFFPLYETGPSGSTFNFADADPDAKPEAAPQMFWLARAFHQPAFGVFEAARLANAPVSIWDLIYSIDPVQTGPQILHDLPLQRVFHGVQDLGVARSSWESPDAAWVALKGGDNKAGHSHLDLGSFVFEVLGQRWGIDGGRDDYGLPGYFGKERYHYFRTSTPGHSTLVFDNQNQLLDGKANILSSGARNGNDYFFLVDLSQAYGVGQVQRRFDLIGNRSLRITDDINTTLPHQIVWSMLTQANVQLNGRRAVLSQNGRTIYARILSPDDGQFQIQPGSGPPPEGQSPVLKRLAIVLLPTARTQIVVELGNWDQP